MNIDDARQNQSGAVNLTHLKLIANLCVNV